MDRLIRLVILEDHPLVAAGASATFTGSNGIEVVGVAHQVDDAVQLVIRTEATVVLCDVMIGNQPAGFDLPEALADTPNGRVPVLFYSSYDLPWFVNQALKSGGAGYVLKTESLVSLQRAIRQVATGGSAFPAAALRPSESLRRPSRREREIIVLAGRGQGNGEIAATLGISQKTIESHLARLFLRYGVKSRTELAILAVGQGWLQISATRGLEEM